jgi:hypothetical protein
MKPGISPWVYLIAVLNIILHAAFYNTLGFHRDELLYFSLGQHLSAGYASVPPMIGFLAWVMIKTLGYSLIACRLIPLIFSGIMVMLTAAVTRELKGGSYAQIMASLSLVITPFCLRTYGLFMPVFLDCFFWTLIIFTLLRWINTRKDYWLIAFGISAGLGMLNKYLVAVEVFAILIALLASPYRSIFIRKYFWLASAAAILVFLPNLIWQIVNGFPVLIHMRALHDSQLVHVNRLDFFTDQIFIGFLGMLAVIPGIIFLFRSKSLREFRPLAWASILAFLMLFALRGKSYYTIGLFPFWIAAGGVFWEKLLKNPASRIALPLTCILLTLPALPMDFPVFDKQGLADYCKGARQTTGLDMFLRWENGRVHSLPQDYADMLGWDEMATLTAKAYSMVPDKKSCMIYAENYGEAGAVMVLGKKYGLPEPVCFSESFFYWFPRHSQTEIKSLIYINGELGSDISQLFADCRLVGQVSDSLAREYGTGVWLCTSPRSSFNRFWSERVPMITDPFH